MNTPSDYIAPHLVSNAIILMLLFAAWRWPNLARYGFSLMFFAASIANTIIVLNDPASYVDLYGGMAMLDFYRSFIHGFFSLHTIPIVLVIAAGQLCVSALLLASGRLQQLGALGAGVFFLAILPLGVGSAFPFPLIAIAALAVMTRQAAREPGQRAVSYD